MKRLAQILLFTISLLAGAAITAALLPGCINAPHSVGDLASMPEPAFQSWKARVAAVAEEGSRVYAAEHGPESMVSLASALRVIAGAGEPGDIAAIAGDYSGLLKLALLELDAAVSEKWGDAAAAPRIKELLAAVADGIESGAAERPSK